MRACYGSLGESEEACVESSVTIPRDASCVCRCIQIYATVSSQTKDNVLKRRWPFFNRQLIDFLTLDYSIPHCCDCRAASSERAREMLAGPAAARREKTLGTHLFMELFAFSRESPRAMGRSSEVKVDFDKSHIHKRSGTPPKFSDIPTNSAKKCWICHEAQRYRQWCAFFARLCSMSARRRMWTFLVFCPLLTSKSSQATWSLGALAARQLADLFAIRPEKWVLPAQGVLAKVSFLLIYYFLVLRIVFTSHGFRWRFRRLMIVFITIA